MNPQVNLDKVRIFNNMVRRGILMLILEIRNPDQETLYGRGFAFFVRPA